MSSPSRDTGKRSNSRRPQRLDNLTASRRHRCASVGLQGPTTEEGHASIITVVSSMPDRQARPDSSTDTLVAPSLPAIADVFCRLCSAGASRPLAPYGSEIAPRPPQDAPITALRAASLKSDGSSAFQPDDRIVRPDQAVNHASQGQQVRILGRGNGRRLEHRQWDNAPCNTGRKPHNQVCQRGSISMAQSALTHNYH
jgi:hypothetical protein